MLSPQSAENRFMASGCASGLQPVQAIVTITVELRLSRLALARVRRLSSFLRHQGQQAADFGIGLRAVTGPLRRLRQLRQNVDE